MLCFQSPPKGESANEENKEVSATPASEPSSQEATPEKGKDTDPNQYSENVDVFINKLYF